MQYNRAAGSEEAVYVEWIKNGLNQPAGVDVRGKKCTLTLKTNFNLLNFPFMWLLCDRGVTLQLWPLLWRQQEVWDTQQASCGTEWDTKNWTTDRRDDAGSDKSTNMDQIIAIK